MLELRPDARILLVRTDNIGDVLLTLPAVASLRKRYPAAFIAYLCRSYTAPLFEGNPSLDQVIAIDGEPRFGVLRKIKDLKFDASIHFYVEPKGILLSVLAGIPKRVGPFSKIWSALLTERIVQDRSKAEKHEALYNLDLVKFLRAEALAVAPDLHLTAHEKKEGAGIISLAFGSEGLRPVVVHPGTKGHVESWPLRSFLELAIKFGDRGEKVLFTAGTGEEGITDAVLGLSHKNVRAIPAGSLDLRQLSSVIFQARLFIGNSSGPLHIATAVGVPTVSFFPKEPRVTSARRWGPFGNDRINRVFTPDDPEDFLASVAPERVLRAWAG